MTYAHDIPGYAQGFRFKNEPIFYDSASARFKDLAGYGYTNELAITTGVAIFATPAGANGQQGMTLDNTDQGAFLPAAPWDGSMVVVIKPNMSVNGTIYPLIFGAAASVGSNGTLRIVRSTASSYSLRLITAGSTQSASITKASDAIYVAAFEMNQEDAQFHYSEDGVTVSSTTASTDDNQGNDEAIGYYSGGDFTGHKARFGNISGTLADTVASTNTATIFELHTFSSRILTDHNDAAQAFLTTLRNRYGVA